MSVSGPIDPRPAAPSKTAVQRDLFLVVIAGLLLFSLNVDFRIRGDAALYADYVLRARFDQLTLHVGYYALLFAAHRTLGALFGIPIQETAVWLNVVAGALMLGVSYLLARHFLGTRRDALLCVAVLAVSGRVLDNATTSEIYMTQMLFVLSSFWLFVRERVVAAGVMAAFALLVSPLSAIAYLFFPVFDYQRAGRIRWPVLLRLAGGALVVYLPYLLVFGKELLWGTRGLLAMDNTLRLRPLAMLHNFPVFTFKTYTVMLLLLIPALFAVAAQRRFLWLTLAVALPHLYIILKLTSEDNVFILNADFFFACWLVIGWRVLAQSRPGRWVAPLPWLGHVALLLASGSIFRFDPGRGYAAEMRSIAQTCLEGRSSVILTDWSARVVLTFFGRPAPADAIEKEPLFRRIFDMASRARQPRALDVEEIYVLDSWKPGELNQLLRSREAIRTQINRYSLVVQAEQRFNLQCTLLREGTWPLYRCQRRTAGTGVPGVAQTTDALPRALDDFDRTIAVPFRAGVT